MTDCKICGALESSFYEQNEIYVVLNPKVSPHLGRLAVIPYVHLKTFGEFTKQVFFHHLDLSEVVAEMETALYRAFNPADIALFYKGKAGEHFHIDLVPMYDVEEVEIDVGDETLIFETKKDVDKGILLRSYSLAPEMSREMRSGIEAKILQAMGINKDEKIDQALEKIESDPTLPK